MIRKKDITLPRQPDNEMFCLDNGEPFIFCVWSTFAFGLHEH